MTEVLSFFSPRQILGYLKIDRDRGESLRVGGEIQATPDDSC